MEYAAMNLTEYPIKAWTLPPGTTLADLARTAARRGVLRRGNDE